MSASNSQDISWSISGLLKQRGAMLFLGLFACWVLAESDFFVTKDDFLRSFLGDRDDFFFLRIG